MKSFTVGPHNKDRILATIEKELAKGSPMTSNLTRDEIVGRRDNAVRQIHVLEHAPISNASAIADCRFDIALCDLALKQLPEKGHIRTDTGEDLQARYYRVVIEPFNPRCYDVQDAYVLCPTTPGDKASKTMKAKNAAAQAAATGGG